MFFFSIYFSIAQDTILKIDGNEQIGKIIEINGTQVKYKSVSNLTGPTYVLSKDNILKISYSNGTIDSFPENKKKLEQIFIDPRNSDFGRNFISLNLFDLLNDVFTLSYEYTFNSGDFSIKIPLSFGFISLGLADSTTEYNSIYSDNGSDNDYYNKNKLFSTGLDFYCYPSGQGLVKYFTGVSLEFGLIKTLSVQYNSLPPYSTYFQKENSRYMALLFQNGVLFQPGKHINISINAGIGYSRLEYNDLIDGNIVFRAGLNFGYKF